MHIKAQRNSHPKILFGPIVNIGYLSRPELEAFNGAFHLVDLESGVDVVRLPGFSLKDYVITQTFGYCNGMICAEVLKKSAKNYFKNRHPLFGNPSTGVYKILPDPTDENPPRNLLVGDLGMIPPLTITSLSIYWLVPSNNMIVGFDLKYEEFSNVPLPCDMQIDELSLKLVGGYMLFFYSCFTSSSLMELAERGVSAWSGGMKVYVVLLFLFHELFVDGAR
ncbi:hypothetical protein LguiA_007331 [Lonicera macranthoides]